MANLISLLALVISITIHEFAHAFVADRLGDPTARSQDRVTLNPLKHLDPLGTLMLIFAGIGWGKPVPVDPYNFRNPRRDEILVSFAGPASNLILAALLSLLSKVFEINLIPIYIIIFVNLTLAVFNLLPIPPLDGSKIFLNLLPMEKSIQWQEAFDRYGFFILALFLFLPFGNSNLIQMIISPIISFLSRLLIPGY